MGEHITLGEFDLISTLLGGVIVCLVIPVFRYWIKKIEGLEKRVEKLEGKNNGV